MVMTPGPNYINSPIRLQVAFRTDSSDLVDPPTVTLSTMSPACVQTTYSYGDDDEMSRISTGVYAADITPDESGMWSYRWVTTGTNTTTAIEGDFWVQESVFDTSDADEWT